MQGSIFSFENMLVDRYLIANTWNKFIIIANLIPTVTEERVQKSKRSTIKKSKTIPVNRPWMPIGLWDVKDPTIGS
jgi:hypothetical protein